MADPCLDENGDSYCLNGATCAADETDAKGFACTCLHSESIEAIEAADRDDLFHGEYSEFKMASLVSEILTKIYCSF